MADETETYWRNKLGKDEKTSKPGLSVVVDNSDLVLRAARMPDPANIPPRRWLYGTQLLRGYVSVLVAPGGVGKSGYAMAVGVAIASGRALLGDKIFQSCPVAVLNLEDPMEELERRLAALMIYHNVSRAELADRYYLYSSDDRRVTMAAISPDGYEIVHPDEAAIIREITAHGIGLLVVDPYAESHDLEENSNPQMIKAAAAWRRIARATSSAILLIHHVRKGTATDIDAARGAKGLTDSARVGLLMSAMTEEEAQGFDLPVEERTSYVRLDDAKANMARKAGVAKWFHIETVTLNNATDDYPNGDRVAALRLWRAPSLMGDLTPEQCNLALDGIEEGPRPGVRYSHSRAGTGNKRWAGDVLMDLFGIGEQRAGAIVRVWVKSGVLKTESYKDAEQRRMTLGLFVVAANRPGNGSV